MAATSTNKQPLLVDHVLHYVVNLDTAATVTMDISGTNTAVLIVDATTSDGAILEDVYTIARGTAPSKVNLYMSTARDYLRPGEGVYVGQIATDTTTGTFTQSDELPKILAPMPHTGDVSFASALYIPKGKALWATLQLAGPNNTADTPIIGAQGGYY